MKKIVQIIRRLGFEITDANDLKNISGIGKGTIKRIDEILKTGTLQELANKYEYDQEKAEKINSIQELEKIIGIGSSTSKRLITDYGITSINDLRKAIKSGKIKATSKILLGLKYYGVVKDKIPRAEITETEKYLAKTASSIDPDLHIVVCGSYRRGKAFSGDIDVLVYYPKAETLREIINPKKYGLEPYLELFVKKLTRDGFLLDDLDKNFDRKYMGFSKYKSYPVRRIDIRYVPYNSLPTATLHYTGPHELNIAMRKAAKKRSMKLSEYGLYKVDMNGIETPVKIGSEEDVFRILGMPYLTPVERESFVG
jgi:DNA polymerase beta